MAYWVLGCVISPPGSPLDVGASSRNLGSSFESQDSVGTEVSLKFALLNVGSGRHRRRQVRRLPLLRQRGRPQRQRGGRQRRLPRGRRPHQLPRISLPPVQDSLSREECEDFGRFCSIFINKNKNAVKVMNKTIKPLLSTDYTVWMNSYHLFKARSFSPN